MFSVTPQNSHLIRGRIRGTGRVLQRETFHNCTQMQFCYRKLYFLAHILERKTENFYDCPTMQLVHIQNHIFGRRIVEETRGIFVIVPNCNLCVSKTIFLGRILQRGKKRILIIAPNAIGIIQNNMFATLLQLLFTCSQPFHLQGVVSLSRICFYQCFTPYCIQF